MEITKQNLETEIERMNAKIQLEGDEVRRLATLLLDIAPEHLEFIASVEYSRKISLCEKSIAEYVSRRDAFKDILNNL